MQHTKSQGTMGSAGACQQEWSGRRRGGRRGGHRPVLPEPNHSRDGAGWTMHSGMQAGGTCARRSATRRDVHRGVANICRLRPVALGLRCPEMVQGALGAATRVGCGACGRAEAARVGLVGRLGRRILSCGMNRATRIELGWCWRSGRLRAHIRWSTTSCPCRAIVAKGVGEASEVSQRRSWTRP